MINESLSIFLFQSKISFGTTNCYEIFPTFFNYTCPDYSIDEGNIFFLLFPWLLFCTSFYSLDSSISLFSYPLSSSNPQHALFALKSHLAELFDILTLTYLPLILLFIAEVRSETMTILSYQQENMPYILAYLTEKVNLTNSGKSVEVRCIVTEWKKLS